MIGKSTSPFFTAGFVLSEREIRPSHLRCSQSHRPVRKRCSCAGGWVSVEPDGIGGRTEASTAMMTAKIVWRAAAGAESFIDGMAMRSPPEKRLPRPATKRIASVDR